MTGYSRFFEMAMARRELSLRIGFITPEIHAQILKLKLFPESPDVPHWTEKLMGHAVYIHHKFKNTNKYPDSEFYFKHLTSNLGDEEYYENRKSAIQGKYRTSKPYEFPNFEEFENFIKLNMRKLSDTLSESLSAGLKHKMEKFIKEI